MATRRRATSRRRTTRRRSTDHWIQRAIRRKGAFRAKARRAGMSTAAYARHVLRAGSRAGAVTKAEARLSQRLAKYRKKRRKR